MYEGRAGLQELFQDRRWIFKEEKKRLYDICLVLQNLNKNSSIHASGLVIAPGNVTDYVPLSKVTCEDNVFAHNTT
ncbi:MAG: hypothetical protein IPG02_19930 [Ignavibacteria bacterium]|nr:hypothetical protein [Ignavibacteria bacterium]